MEGRGLVSGVFFPGCLCRGQRAKAQTEEFAKAAAEAAGQIAQQDDARCQSYGRPGSAAYIDCRTALKKRGARDRRDYRGGRRCRTEYTTRESPGGRIVRERRTVCRD